MLTSFSLRIDNDYLPAYNNTYVHVENVVPSNAHTDLTWKSSNKKVATIDADGNIQGQGIGKSTITATDKVTGVSATVTLTII